MASFLGGKARILSNQAGSGLEFRPDQRTLKAQQPAVRALVGGKWVSLGWEFLCLAEILSCLPSEMGDSVVKLNSVLRSAVDLR